MFSRLAPPAAAFALSAFAADARADITSWFFTGAGVTSLAGDSFPTRRPGTLRFEAGLGSAPGGAVVVGGLAQSTTYFGSGTDWSLVARLATGSFVRGGFGVAIDAGGYERWWGAGSSGLAGAVVFGAPFGLALALTTEQGTNDVHSYGAVLGVDFLRLTVYRTTLGDFWPNPFPVRGYGAANPAAVR